jgi:malonyl-CoA/methylmalonyl-CoA synthetase
MTSTPDLLDLLETADRSGVAVRDDSRAVDYAELAPTVRCRAAALAGHGLAAGDRLVVEVANSAAAVELYLGCLLLGAVWVGVNPAAPQAERQRLCALVRPALVVTDQPAAAPGGYRVVELAGLLDDTAGPWTEPAPPADRPCAIAFTSGTSGSPKPVVQTWAGASLTAAAAATRFRTNDRVGLILPLSIHNVMVVGAMATLLAGATAVVVTGLNARGVARACAEDRLTMLSALVPTTIFDLVHDDGIAPDALRSLRWAGSGGADLSDGLRAGFEDKFGVGVLGSYGLTEAGGVVSMEEPGTPHRLGCSGSALPHTRIEIRDEAGQQLGPGQRGRVYVCPASDGPWAGLFSPPGWDWTETGMRLRPDQPCLATGDFGALDGDGGVYIHGRDTGVIVRGGVNVTAAEVEAALAGFDTVREAVVVGEPDERLGERVVAFVESKSGAVVDAAQLTDQARKVLSRGKVPDEFVIVASLPRNALGKVVRSQLSSLRPTPG